MLAGDKSYRQKLEDAYNVRPDIAFIARAIKERGIKGLDKIHIHVGVPIFAALCQRLPTADEMIEKMGNVAVEPKYDGVRCQIHWKKKGFVRSFSRNLENTTQMFPELLDIEKQLDADEVILDSEAVGIDPATGKILPFQETTTRKRKYEIELFSSQVPIRFFVFDILYKDGNDMLLLPLSKRREILEKTIKDGDVLSVSPLIVTESAETLRQYHDMQIKKGLEGVVIKKWESPYDSGRRNYSWVKFKEEEGKTGKLADTVDAVVMGFYRGEGKRAGFGIGAFLVGVRKGETIVTITKIGTGVSDDLWKELKIRFEKLETVKQPPEYASVTTALIPDVWINPKLVVEIAGDDLTKSPNHGAGIALRFPRLVGIREDKGPQEATTLEEVIRMYENQESVAQKKHGE
jgi:DNA ligase-1